MCVRRCKVRVCDLCGMCEHLFMDKELQLLALRTKTESNCAQRPDATMWSSTNSVSSERSAAFLAVLVASSTGPFDSKWRL